MGFETEAEKDLDLKGLGQFCGTMSYHMVGLGSRVTDGVKYIMDNGYSWFVTDALAIMRLKTELKREPFLVVRLKLNKDKETADMVIDDGNYNELYTQQYDYTDAKQELKLYFTDNVLMLAEEY